MAETRAKRDGKLHKGHRQRLKNKVRLNSLESLNEHEILELMLTYSIPYKDTNELAHRLIDSYREINKVFDTSREELMLNNGVGEETALFLNILGQLYKYLNKKANNTPIRLTNVQECVNYFRNNLSVGNKENAYLVFTDNKGYFVKLEDLGEGNQFDIKLERGRLNKMIATTGAKNCVFFHTHPFGSVQPSMDDLIATRNLMSLCHLSGIKLFDHLIINQTEYFSFYKTGIMQEVDVETAKKLDQIFHEKIGVGDLNKNEE